MRLAYELGRTEEEIMNLPASDFARWVAFFKILNEQKRKDNQPAISRRR